jgi:HEAT repeat protein
MNLTWPPSLKSLFRLPEGRHQRAYPTDRLATIEWMARADVADPESEKAVIDSSRSWDGHIREAAVRKLAGAASAESFRAVIERLNDWVPQVRQAAAQACQSRIDPAPLDVVLACLDSVLALTGQSRADHSLFLSKVGRLLESPQAHSEVAQFFVGSRGPVARYLLECLLAGDASPADTLLLAAKHADFTVRSAALAACENPDVAIGAEIMHSLLSDPHPIIRRNALRVSLTRPMDGEAKARLIRSTLMDRSHAVREFGIWHAKKSGFDLDAFLAQQANRSPDRRALIGLIDLIAMLSKIAYLPLIQQTALDENPRLRQAALVAWVGLSRQTADIAVARSLADPSGKLARLAAMLVRRGKVALSGEQLSGAAEMALDQGNLSRLLVVSQLMPIWDRLECLLGVMVRLDSSEDKMKMKLALREWERDKRKSFSGVSAGQAARLRALVELTGYADMAASEQNVYSVLSQYGLLEQRS